MTAWLCDHPPEATMTMMEAATAYAKPLPVVRRAFIYGGPGQTRLARADEFNIWRGCPCRLDPVLSSKKLAAPVRLKSSYAQSAGDLLAELIVARKRAEGGL